MVINEQTFFVHCDNRITVTVRGTWHGGGPRNKGHEQGGRLLFTFVPREKGIQGQMHSKGLFKRNAPDHIFFYRDNFPPDFGLRGTIPTEQLHVKFLKHLLRDGYLIVHYFT
jgi:hypothetical protein